MTNQPFRLGSSGPNKRVIPAATALLIRDSPEGAQVLMLRRNSKLEFAGGFWVFPGGRVDEADMEAAAARLSALMHGSSGTGGKGLETDESDRALGDLAERIAAARECEEEAGIHIEADSLVRWSQWNGPPEAVKRFNTAFFVAVADTHEVTIDEGEIHDHLWATPHEVLAQHAQGEIELAPPTFITLSEIRHLGATSQILAQAAARPTEVFATRFTMAGDTVAAMYHGDVLYEALGENASDDPPVVDLEADGPRHRLLMTPGNWQYQRDTSPT